MTMMMAMTMLMNVLALIMLLRFSDFEWLRNELERDSKVGRRQQEKPGLLDMMMIPSDSGASPA